MEHQSLCADDCLEDVVRAYSDMVYRQAFSYARNKPDADDIYQEVFLRYIKKKPRFETEKHREAWLIRVTINCCKNLRVSAWKNKTLPLEDNIAFESEEEYSLHFELMKLPPKYK